MKTSKWLKEIPFVILFVMPWIVLALIQDKLPERIPTHWTATSKGWEVNGTMTPVGSLTGLSIVMLVLYIALSLPAWQGKAYVVKTFYYFKLAMILFICTLDLFLLCAAAGVVTAPGHDMLSNASMLLVMIIINVFLYAIFKISKKQEKLPLPEKYYNIMWAGTHFISTLPMILVLFAAQAWVIQRILPQGIFLFLAITGNILYSVKPNYFFGIRTPWTLANEDVWRKTHQNCAKWFFIGGVTGFVISIFAPLEWLHPLLLVMMTGLTVYSMVYSYILSKKSNPPTTH